MKAIVSTTFDNKYLFFLPICVWAWNKIGVDVICFIPNSISGYTGQEILNNGKRLCLAEDTVISSCSSKQNMTVQFSSEEHKEATYAQCSRLYGACLNFPEEEIIVCGDIDMLPFPELKRIIDSSVIENGGRLTSFGYDLVPVGQLPICYAWGSKKEWESVMEIKGRTYQQCLDDELGELESTHFRGNFWCRDQEIMQRQFIKSDFVRISRARTGTQFARQRVDRDDINWGHYLGSNLIDAHLWRPGYAEENFVKIIELLHFQYPEENLQWMWDYRNEYIKLL